MGQLHRVAREHDDHVGGQLKGRGGTGGQDQRSEDVMRPLERESPVHSQSLEPAGVGGSVLQPGQHRVDLHQSLQ